MNLAAMRTRVRRPFKWDADDSECTGIVDDNLNDAYDWLNAQRRWRGLQVTDVSLSITAAVPTEDAPSSWRCFTGVYIINSAGSAKELQFVTWDQCLHNWGDPSTLTPGVPSYYAIKSDTSGLLGLRKLIIEPIPHPDQTFTLRLNGIYRPARFTSATQLPWFDEQYHVILPMYATALIGMSEAGWDRDKCDRYMQRAIDLMEQMAHDEPDGVTPTSTVPLVGE